MVKLTKPSGMKVSDLEATYEFSLLTPRQRTFVSALIGRFIETSKLDLTAATLTAYVCRTTENARVFSYQLLSNVKVQAVLRLYANFGKSERQIAIEELDTQIEKAEPGSTAASQLLAQRNSLKFGTSQWSGGKNSTGEKGARSAAVADPTPVPAGATPLVDAAGVVRGYKTADGQYVQLAEVSQ